MILLQRYKRTIYGNNIIKIGISQGLMMVIFFCLKLMNYQKICVQKIKNINMTVEQVNYPVNLMEQLNNYQYMNIYNLWFIKYDSMLFRKHLKFSQLRKIIRNHKNELTDCKESNIQLHLYQMIKFLDYFFNLQNVVELLEYRIQSFTQRQVSDIQQKTIEFRLIIECQKIYCQEFWLNKKLNWDVQVRILACLCRIYLFIKDVHYFLVGQSQSLWQRSKKNKLFIPIEHWEKFINQIYSKLIKFDKFYYEYQYPYINEIHEFLQEFKYLLHNFPKLLKDDIPSAFSLFNVILKQNQKFINNFRIKIFKPQNNFIDKSEPKKYRKNKSLQYQKKKILQLNGSISFIYKLQKKYSIQHNIMTPFTESICEIQNKLYPIILEKIHKRRQKKQSNSSLKHSNSEYASTREITPTKELFEFMQYKQQNIQPQVSKQQNLFLADSKIIKVKSRRTYNQKTSSKKVIDKNIDNILIDFNLDFGEQKQEYSHSLRNFYDGLPYISPPNLIKISLLQEQSLSRKLKYEGLASKLKIGEKKLKEILRNQEIQIPKLKIKQNKKCI